MKIELEALIPYDTTTVSMSFYHISLHHMMDVGQHSLHIGINFQTILNISRG